MSTTPINVAVDGTVISASIVNQYFNALIGDIIPRNSNGDATDQSANLGSTLFRWLKIYLDEVHIGTIAEDTYIKLIGTSPNQILEIFIGGVLKARIDQNGFNGNDIGIGSIGNDKLANKTVDNTKIKDNTIINSLLTNDCIHDGNILNREVTREKTSNVQKDSVLDASFSTSSTTPILLATLTVALYDVAGETDASTVPKPFIVGISPLKTTSGLCGITYNGASDLGVIRLTKTIGAGSETTICNWNIQGVVTLPATLTYFDDDFTNGVGTATNIVYKFYAYVSNAATTISYTNLKFYAYSLK